MKSIFTLLLLLFTIMTAFCQNLACKVTFKDGAIFEGFSKITKKEKVLFRLVKNDIPDRYGPDEISEVAFYQKNGTRIFEYVKIKARRKKPKYLLMEKIENGKISLFQHYKTSLESNQTGFEVWDGLNNFPNPLPTGEVVHTVEKYLKVKNSEIAIDLNNPGDIKEILTESFADCPSALNELEIIELKGNNIDDLVWQYNRDCAGDKSNE